MRLILEFDGVEVAKPQIETPVETTAAQATDGGAPAESLLQEVSASSDMPRATATPADGFNGGTPAEWLLTAQSETNRTMTNGSKTAGATASVNPTFDAGSAPLDNK